MVNNSNNKKEDSIIEKDDEIIDTSNENNDNTNETIEENTLKFLCTDKKFDEKELSSIYKCNTYDPNYESSSKYNIKVSNKKTNIVLSDKQNKEILKFNIKSEYDEISNLYKLDNYYISFVTNQYNDNYKGESYTNYVVVGNSNNNFVTIDLEKAVKDNYIFEDDYDIYKISSDGIYLMLLDNTDGLNWKTAIFRIPLENNKLKANLEFVQYYEET